MSLLQLYQNYLNQALPDISGIFRSTPAQAMEETTEETIAQPAGLTPQQLALLYPQQNQGGEGIQSLDVQDFQDAIAARQERIANPDPISQFIYNAIPGLQPQSIESIMSGGAQRQMTIPGLTGLLSKTDKYYDLPYGDQAFIASQMGYSDPNTGMANKDPFGINTRSAFGNYGEYVEDRSTELADYLSGDLADKYDVTYDFETGQYVGANAKKANQMTSRLRTEQQFYADQTKKRNQFIQDSFKKQQDKQDQVDTGDITTGPTRPVNIVDEVALTGGDNNSGGGGFDREDRGPGASSRGGTSATDSGLGNLGFSDIRLKENVELIGKSPSNINIYKFNYKDNSTTYQGVMAHEVPWANVKHSNGYMMVDYDKVDVEFKKWQR